MSKPEQKQILKRLLDVEQYILSACSLKTDKAERDELLVIVESLHETIDLVLNNSYE